MTSKDWFILGARLFGLWVIYNGISYGAVVIERMVGIEAHPREAVFAPGTYIISCVWHLFFGAFLVLKTEALARVVCLPAEPTNGPPPSETN